MADKWFLPSFYGDVRLQLLDKKLTRVNWEKLTVKERAALDALAVKAQKKWNPRGAVESVKETPKSTSSLTSLTLFAGNRGSILLDASLDDVRRVLARTLKPGRAIIDVVKFADGKIVEETAASAEGAVAGVSVAQPELGCPEPRLARAELQAREVLFEFITPEQREDFTLHNAFVSHGAGTGHRYMVTSRHARDNLARYRRQLYDLDEKQPYCVHDYLVPAPEEMLALHLFLQLPWGERYVRHLH